MFTTQKQVPSLTALAIIVAFAAGVFGGAFFYKSWELSQADAILNSTLPAVIVPSASAGQYNPDPVTADWVVYRNEKLGYEIKHPGALAQVNWTDDYPGAQLFADFQGKVGSTSIRLSVRVDEKKYNSLTQFLAEIDALQATGYEGQPSVAVNKERKLTVAGKEAVQREQDFLAAGFPDVSTHIFDNGTIIVISTHMIEDPAGLLAFHNQALSTFRLLK